MRKLLLTLLLLAVAGCSAEDFNELFLPYKETRAGKAAAARWERADERKAMLKDGRIHIGMTDNEFAKLWEKPWGGWIDRSVHASGVTEWWKFNLFCEPSSPRSFPTYCFYFENGVLTYWSEN